MDGNVTLSLETAVEITRDPSTYSSAVSLAKTSPTPASGLVWMGPGPDSGSSSTGALASFDRSLSSWRTSQGSLLEASTPYSDAWPTEGMTRNGRLFAHPMLVRRTDVSGSSSSPIGWSTPRQIDQCDGFSTSEKALTISTSKPSLFQQTQGILTNRDWPTPVKEDSESRTSHGTLTDKVRATWPTPQSYSKGKDEDNVPGLTPLDIAARPDLAHLRKDWPTPQTTDANSAGRHTTTTGVMHPGTTLTDAARSGASTWLTPQSRDHKGISQKVAKGEYTGGLPDQLAGLHDQESLSTTGNLPALSPRPVLNPRWVAALMGFPVDWLDGVEVPKKRKA